MSREDWNKAYYIVNASESEKIEYLNRASKRELNNIQTVLDYWLVNFIDDIVENLHQLEDADEIIKRIKNANI
jgi:hypothetical protein